MPRKHRRDILADTYGGRLLPDASFETLWAAFVAQPQRGMVTPNVLQEVWKASLPKKLRLSPHDFLNRAMEFQREFLVKEELVPFQDLWADDAMRELTLKLGVTDAGLILVGRAHSARLLTEDTQLLNYARAVGLEAFGARDH